MTMPHADDLHRAPLSSAQDVLDRATAIVGRACRRQLWPLYLDAAGIQLPVLTPVADIPVSPDAEAPRVIGMLAEAALLLGATELVLVLERPGGPLATPDDLAWADAAERALRGRIVSLRAMLLSHDGGVGPLAIVSG